MGYKLGIPVLKLSRDNKPGKQAASLSKVAAEALSERKCNDPDLDRSLTEKNIYKGFKSAKELVEYSENHIKELSEKNKARGLKTIRRDAITMITLIIKPPFEYMNQLTDKEQHQLLEDAYDELEKIIGADNIKSAVIHIDEVTRHMHLFFEPMMPDGRLCAKEFCNLKFFRKLNQDVPKELCKRGWNIDACDSYDKTKVNMEIENRVNQYISEHPDEQFTPKDKCDLFADFRDEVYNERHRKNGRSSA